MNKRLPMILTCNLSQRLEIILYSRSSYASSIPSAPVTAKANMSFTGLGTIKTYTEPALGMIDTIHSANPTLPASLFTVGYVN